MTEATPIPEEFWRALTSEEFGELVDRHGQLNTEQCERLWKIAKWPDPPPKSFKIMVPPEEAARVEKK